MEQAEHASVHDKGSADAEHSPHGTAPPSDVMTTIPRPPQPLPEPDPTPKPEPFPTPSPDPPPTDPLPTPTAFM
jgi:hypothetical protein